MSYKVESDFDYKGLRCVVILSGMGHRCGYVGIQKGHPLYGKKYSDNCKILLKSTIENEPIGECGIIPLMCMGNSEYTSPECYFNVHGGVTYSNGGSNSKYPVESDLWWFGFDCAHCNDGKDYKTALKYGLITKEAYTYLTELDKMYPVDETIRTQEYVENQCKNFAEQLLKFTY